MGSEHYCLRWNNHQSNLLGVFSQLLQDESLVDVTLACSEGASIRAHKVVLSACSSYFQSLFLEHPSRHPIVILKDVRFSELRTLVEFMYKGEVNVEYCQLSALLKTAESLKVKGLAEMTNLNATTQENDRDQENMSSRSQQHDMMSRHDTPTRHDRKHNNTATSTATSESQESVNKRLAPPEESDTPPPRLAMSPIHTINPLNPLALPLHCRGMRGRPEPMDPGPDEGPGGGDGHRASSPEDDTVPHRSNCGPSEMGLNMSINANINNASTASSGAATSTATTAGDLRLIQMSSSATSTVIVPSSSRLNSPMAEPIAGPSGLPPVQQVPLSLKKEVDWDRGDDKSSGGSPLEYRHSHDPEMCVDASVLGPHGEGSPRLYPCMYCGAAFPHQSKLTRHILSHSLETLKYREQMHLQHPGLGLSVGLGEPLSLMESHFSGRPPPSLKCEAMGLSGLGSLGDLHEPPDVSMELDFSSGIPDQGNVVLCKFCGKSFPDVSSLIAHLPVHTGDRPFKCEFCGKAFKLRHHMKDHCRVHTGERPFRCGLCGKTFSRSTILKAHEKTHYPKYVRKFLSPSPVDTEEESPHQ